MKWRGNRAKLADCKLYATRLLYISPTATFRSRKACLRILLFAFASASKEYRPFNSNTYAVFNLHDFNRIQVTVYSFTFYLSHETFDPFGSHPPRLETNSYRIRLISVFFVFFSFVTFLFFGFSFLFFVFPSFFSLFERIPT